MRSDDTCSHLSAIESVRGPKRRECDECVKIGAQWVHLRTCQECGTTLCCDQSPNRHAHGHARSSGHPVIASAEPGERWLYCYPDDGTWSTESRSWKPSAGHSRLSVCLKRLSLELQTDSNQ